MQSNVDVNAAWLTNMNKAVDYLSTKCPQSDVLALRQDADDVQSLNADISSRLLRLLAASEVGC